MTRNVRTATFAASLLLFIACGGGSSPNNNGIGTLPSDDQICSFKVGITTAQKVLDTCGNNNATILYSGDGQTISTIGYIYTETEGTTVRKQISTDFWFDDNGLYLEAERSGIGADANPLPTCP